MTGFPSGEWSFLLVGDQWPDDQDLLALSHGKMNRGQVKSGFIHFADMLHNAQTGPLAGQQGHTADDLRDAFCQGENQARRVAEKNGVKESAYGTAYDSTRWPSARPDQLGRRGQQADQRNPRLEAARRSQGDADRCGDKPVSSAGQLSRRQNVAATSWKRCNGSSTRREPGSPLVNSRKPTASTSDKCSGNPTTKRICRSK